MDLALISDTIDKFKSLFEESSGWESKNRLKVYEGLYCMATRDFKKASTLFLDSLSTFTAYELFPYETFIFYTVLTSIVSLDRVSLKQKVFSSELIAAGKLHCKIDKVAGVVETNRPDAKNAPFQATIKRGDGLLNRIQRLSRAIDIEV